MKILFPALGHEGAEKDCPVSFVVSQLAARKGHDTIVDPDTQEHVFISTREQIADKWFKTDKPDPTVEILEHWRSSATVLDLEGPGVHSWLVFGREANSRVLQSLDACEEFVRDLCKGKGYWPQS
jgi:hypothetical protein